MKGRRYTLKSLKPENVTRAQITASAKKISQIYRDFKFKTTKTGNSMLDVRANLMEAVIRVQTEVIHPSMRLLATNGFETMLKRAGGPIDSPDEAFDKAMGQNQEELKKAQPSPESMREAIKILREHGISFPEPKKSNE